jgi:hypothetical protein
MSSTPLALALRIALLLEEHSERELQSAVKLLRERGSRSVLLELLGGASDPVLPKPKRLTSSSRSIEDTTSLAVLQLRESDPDKHRLLSEFDKMVRRGQVLATHEDLKRFGERISKDFQPRKSRKDTIGHLVATMAERPLTEIERLVEFAASFGVAGDTDEYQRLAQFLIRGRPKSN